MDDLVVIKKSLEQSLGAMYTLTNNMQSVVEQVKEHDQLLKRRVYLSMIHGRLLTKTIREKVSQVCVDYKLNYRQSAKLMYSAIYNGLYEAYGVNSYRELPDIFFDDILERVRHWNDVDKIIKRTA